MAGIPPKAERAGRVLWDYLRVGLPPKESRIILVMGCPDVIVAEHAARLMRANLAKSVIVSGGCRLSPRDRRTEAEAFADVIESMGVDSARITREPYAKHTSDHFWQAEKELGCRPESAILCCAPVAEQRALATGRNRWVGTDLSIGGVPVSYDTYLRHAERTGSSAAYVLSRMVGEIDRILAYPGMGFMSCPDSPPGAAVLRAHKSLKMDFNDRPIPPAHRRHFAGA